jgi:hypothetical protein
MRQILPLEFANKRAKYVRNRLYAIAAKVLQHGRRQKNRMTLVEKNKNLSLTALTKICLIVFPKSHWANSGVSF